MGLTRIEIRVTLELALREDTLLRPRGINLKFDCNIALIKGWTLLIVNGFDNNPKPIKGKARTVPSAKNF
jgi:hypothetical protein